MNLYLISQSENHNYDTYDSAVVVAKTPSQAKQIHPSEDKYNGDIKTWERPYGTWATSPKNVTAKYIGKAKRGLKSGIVLCSSFNAG